MKTGKINFLCSYSDRLYDNKKMFENLIIKDVNKIKIEMSYKTITLSLNDYPELIPLVEKLKDYIIKSTESKQNEIKFEILKVLMNEA